VALRGVPCARPNRERETLVGEHTTIINRIKATLARLGIRNFNPKLKKTPERLDHLRTPEGEPIRPTLSLSCSVTSRESSWSPSRSGRSRRRAWSN
jgi:hypothetical protein